jgi:hypothetical protein
MSKNIAQPDGLSDEPDGILGIIDRNRSQNYTKLI